MIISESWSVQTLSQINMMIIFNSLLLLSSMLIFLFNLVIDKNIRHMYLYYYSYYYLSITCVTTLFLNIKFNASEIGYELPWWFYYAFVYVEILTFFSCIDIILIFMYFYNTISKNYNVYDKQEESRFINIINKLIFVFYVIYLIIIALLLIFLCDSMTC